MTVQKTTDAEPSPAEGFRGGWKTMRDGSRVPMSEDEAKSLWDRIEADRIARQNMMPDERSAIITMFSAWLRLKELGWREAQYCPKDGSCFEVIEPGSTGIFRSHYSGEWPDGSWWIEDGGDLWPANPILFRLYPEDQAKEDSRIAELRERFRREVCDGK